MNEQKGVKISFVAADPDLAAIPAYATNTITNEGTLYIGAGVTVKNESNGGEFLGGTVSIGSGYKGDAPTLTINGGTFDHDVIQWLENDESKVLYQANK